VRAEACSPREITLAWTATADLDGQADSPQIPASKAEKYNGDDQHDDQGYQHGGHTDGRLAGASTHLLRAKLATAQARCAAQCQLERWRH
jgi:hypothetical protein